MILLIWHTETTVRLHIISPDLLPHPVELIHYEYLWVEWNRKTQDFDYSLLSSDFDEETASKMRENLLALYHHVDKKPPLSSLDIDPSQFQTICVCGAKYGG